MRPPLTTISLFFDTYTSPSAIYPLETWKGGKLIKTTLDFDSLFWWAFGLWVLHRSTGIRNLRTDNGNRGYIGEEIYKTQERGTSIVETIYTYNVKVIFLPPIQRQHVLKNRRSLFKSIFLYTQESYIWS